MKVESVIPMKTNTTQKINLYRRDEQGAVLIVGLVMLLLMTIVGLSAVSGSNMQELMVGNLRDKSLAFQAAEAGLRIGEDAVNGVNPPDTSGTVKGFVEELPNGTNATYWRESHVWVDPVPANSDSVVTDVDLLVTSEQPRYVVEKLIAVDVLGGEGSGVDYGELLKLPDLQVYRITSRGVGLTNNTVVYLQSIYRRE